MPNRQSVVVGNYYQQWQDGQLTDAQLIVVLLRKYQELSDTYEKLERKRKTESEPTTYPMVTCKGCPKVIPKRAWNTLFCCHACQLRYWRKYGNTVYDPKTKEHRARRPEDKTLSDA